MTDRTKLLAAIKAVNDSGLATKKARTVGKVELLVEDFLSTVETVPQDKENQLPAEVVDLFNTLIDKLAEQSVQPASEAPTPAPVQEPVVTAASEAAAPAAPTKARKAAKPKRATEAQAEAPAAPVTEMPAPAPAAQAEPAVADTADIDTGVGLHKLIDKLTARGDNRTTYVVDKMLVAGASKEEMADVAKRTAIALGQVQYQRGVGDITVHINSRTKSGWVIGETPDGKFKIIGVRKGAEVSE